MKQIQRLVLLTLALGPVLIGSAAQAQTKKPNIVIIWGDDIASPMSAPPRWA